MRVLVTGASGRVGVSVTRDLLEAGHSVRVIDKTPPREEARTAIAEKLHLNPEWRARLETVYDDVTDRLALLRAAEGCDAIVHLAAIPNPSHSNDDTITHINTVGTQYVYAAAEAHEIKRVTVASSCCVFGMVFARHQFDAEYLPLNDDHPRLPQDLYGLSKLSNEETAATYWRRAGIASTCLRLTAVMRLSGEHNPWHRRHLEWSHHNRSRDFWTYVDDRDMARAFRLSIEKPDLEGSHNLIIAARDTYSPYDIRALLHEHYPALDEYSKLFAPRQSAYDTTRAEDVIGWVAEHSWRDSEEGEKVLEELRARDDLPMPLAD